MTESAIPTCGTVIFDKNGRVLLVEHLEGAGHMTGSYGLPAGKIEKGETALEGAVREVREETGLILQKEQLRKLPTVFKAIIQQKDGPKNFSWEVFATQILGDDILKESKETRPHWVMLSDMITLTLVGNVQNAVDEARGIFDI